VTRAQRGIQCGCLLIGELAGMEGERFHAEKLTAKERKEHKEFQRIAAFSRHSRQRAPQWNHRALMIRPKVNIPLKCR
jgi:hypothetical protein